MKVLMLSTDENILRENSEARKRMREYSQYFDELHIIVLTAKDFGKTEDLISENAVAHPTDSRFKFWALWTAYGIGERLLKSGGQWVVTAQDPFENGWIAYRLARQFKAPLQLQVHTDFLSPYFAGESFKNRLRIWIAKRILPKADGVRVVSDRIKKSLIKRTVTGEEKITTLPIFTDLVGIQNVKAGNGQDFLILMASRLTREKNIGLAIEAMADLVKENPKLRLVIVGDGPERRKLQLLITNYRLQNNVVIKPYNDDLASYYKNADLFLLTSNYEGYGRVAVEAAIAAVPVVMTDVGVAIGKVVPVGDRQAVASAVQSLIGDFKERQELVNKQKEVIKNLPSKQEYLTAYANSLKLEKFKKLLFITQKLDLDDDVLGVYHQWVAGLAGKFDKVHVICLYRGRTNLPPNVATHSLGKESNAGRLKYLINFYRYVWRLRNDYDVVFVHMNPEYLILAGWLWRLLGRRVVFWYAHYRGTWKLKLAAIFPDKIVTSVRLAYPFQSRKLEVLQQGIDTERFKPFGDSRFTIQDSGFKILFLGRIAPVKHVDVLLRAFAALYHTDNASLTILGEPTPGKPIETAYYEEIKKLATDLGIFDRVKFLSSVPNYATPGIYNQYDLFINLTDTGSFDKSTLEAMACGLPAIVSNKAFLDIFPENLVGQLMFEENNYKDLAGKITAFIKKPLVEVGKISETMRALIVEKHSLATLVIRLADCLKSVTI